MPTLAKPAVLSIDLDQTFVDAPEAERDDLLNLLETSTEGVRLVYTSHDNAETLISTAAKAHLPVPEMFLADSGTTALKGDGTGTIEPLQRNIIQLWPGKDAVMKILGTIDGLRSLDDASPRRQMVEVDSPEIAEAANEQISGLGCSILHRVDTQWDVLPYGVDKGTSLGRWIVQENVSPSQVIAFGHAAGDLSLFGRGWRGGLFGHANEELLATAKRFHNVRISENTGPRGVMDVLQAFGWLEMSASA